ncbi:aspartate-semialdehyde dehydrogenase [Pseudobacteriovorax antillogorgiicola]|uniref:aspartate-semialdehyde dehydrogenase n=1 Tax=Pseudobacteriovorax antillogorgiicola TaxID=1513793 RepID=A0A1Y6CBQ3_9BACT|nr:aspartate-semialdehyde dehydrogenase [Pseudobacteriovorax antillogorgiicola]TCS48579.1 aspartate-semialdehyde dehydrogenase [Pseudobacteriovorax antillogorgiicola]SMF55706.1 aspartate-semialdehyde dehydrogenase [Pseudobacteriovorax antillogorgiicola]
MKKKVAVVGATGIAGQQFLTALENHPWFEVVALAGSPRSAGKTYEDALKTPSGQINWWQNEAIPKKYKQMVVELATELDPKKVDIVFTAVESDAARELEPLYAKHRPTISTASAFRMEDDVPLLIPGVNTNHVSLIKKQQANRDWQGFVIPIPNCTTYGLACSLAPLHKAFGVKGVVMTSMQATSGAGRNGGVLSLDMLDNLVPYIPKEEEKVEIETQKILGTLEEDQVKDAAFGVSCTCTRVPVTDGHTETVFVATDKPAPASEVEKAFREYQTGLEGLPSAPKDFYLVHDDPFHPQPRIDRDKDGGMSTHIGRIRDDKVLSGTKYVLLSHNTKAGAAKGAILIAEYLCHTGVI